MYFSFCPTKRIYGERSIRTLMHELAEAKRIAVVASGSSMNGTAIFAELESVASRIVLQKVITGAGEPSYQAAAALADEFFAAQITHIIAIGGGSIIDLAKAAALMAQYEGDSETKWEKLVASPFDVSAIPLVAVSTVPGTSSESNSTFVISDPKGYKRAIAKIGCFPIAMAFDPSFSGGVSTTQLHLGMFDAFTHVLEQFIRPEPVCLTNDGLCISMTATLLDLHQRLLNDRFTMDDLLRYSRISSVIIDGSLLGRGVYVDGVTHEIATFLSSHFQMAHSTTLAHVLPEYLEHPASAAKKSRFDHLLTQSVAAVNAFYDRTVVPAFDLRSFIAETGIIAPLYDRLSSGNMEAEILRFLGEREGLWSQKSVAKADVEEVLRKVLKTVNA